MLTVIKTSCYDDRMKIFITNGMKELARDMAATAIKNKAAFADYGFDDEERYYTGSLGELAFVSALKARNKKAFYQPSLNKPDEGDVKLFSIKGTMMADVKTGSKPSYKKFLVPPRQYEAHPDIIYVAVRLDNDVAEIMGFCVPKDLVVMKADEHNLKVDSMGIMYENMRSIDSLMNFLKDGDIEMDLVNVERERVNG